MSIMIDKSKCIGCGKCCMVCPGSLIKKDGDNKAFIKYFLYQGMSYARNIVLSRCGYRRYGK